VTWTWFTPDVADELRRISSAAAGRYQLLDEGDIFSELCLYLAVRPDRTVSLEYIRSTAWRHIQRMVKSESDHQERFQLTIDEPRDGGEDW